MSTVLHMPTFNTAPHGPAFTSVNGPSSLSPTTEQKPPIVAKSSTWSPASRGPDTSYHSPRSDTSPSTISSRDRSPEIVNKRRRSASEEDCVARRSPGEVAAASRQLPHPYQSMGRDTLPSMDAPQQPSLPPLGRPDAERRWQTEPRELPHSAHQHFDHREPRPVESARTTMSSDSHAHIGSSAGEAELDETSTTEVTRAGVQVELKKRKRVSESTHLRI